MDDAVESAPGYEPDPYNISLEALDPALPELFYHGAEAAYFARLRKEDPVHLTPLNRDFGRYWSVTRYADIKYVDTHHDIFSSARGITIRDQDVEFTLPMFIAMDPPKHGEQRSVVAPAAGPRRLASLEATIRGRVAQILDSLPRGETFDWVDRVSIELTTQMLATLFDIPFEDRRKLARWSDVTTALPDSGIVESEEQRRAEMMDCLRYFTGHWLERKSRPEPGGDLISLLVHGEATRDMLDHPKELLGNLLLLIVGGNDTTRNSLSAGVLALNENPREYDKLRAEPERIPNMVSEIIRWQTPLAHMRRTALVETELGGKRIKAGDKVIMWYISGNRDETVFDEPDAFRIDRPNARKHTSFGYGIHRCMGNRVAEMQLRIAWEEILKRFETVEVVGPAKRNYSVFVRGYTELPVRLIER